MPALKDTAFFKELTKRESDNATIYAGKLLEISDDVGRFLEYTKTTFPDYPDHGIQHSCRILNYVARVIGTQICSLSDTEIFCFVLAALFHDTGMSLVGFAAKNTMRSKHPVNAAVAIDEYFDKALFTLKNKERIKTIVTYICKAHGLDLDAMYKDREFYVVDTINGDNVRNSILSVFLRIGDLLDLDEERTSWLALKLFPKVFSEEAKAHNIRHLNVQKYRYDAESLDIEVKVHNITEYKIWNEWLGYLENDILYANTYLKKEKIYFPALSKSIKKDDNADFDIEEIRFELDDTGGIFEIISQSIYTNEFDFIREVIQNAIDATLVDTYLNETLPTDHPSPRSWKLSYRATPVYVCYSASRQMLHIIDNGIGMNNSDLRRFLFKVSSTGYRDTNNRAFPFPSIAKYGIGFVSCLINAEKIDIYTAKEDSNHILKVTLETGINQAFIEKISSANYIGTTLAIKLKHQYSFDKIHDYVFKIFQYPSVEICCINTDTLLINAQSLNAENTFERCAGSPFRLIDFVETIRLSRDKYLQPLQAKTNELIEIQNVSEKLISWIKVHSKLSEAYSDHDKFVRFKTKIGELYNSIRDPEVKKQFPFSQINITEKELFTITDTYTEKLNSFVEYLAESIGKNSKLTLKQYPAFYYKIIKNQVAFEGDWNYIVVGLDEWLNISSIDQYKEPIDLSQRTGLILIKHTYQNYDEGIEYAAINGFLFAKGKVTTQLIQAKGYHEVVNGVKREGNYLLTTFDSFGSIADAIMAEYLNISEYDDDEPYFIRTAVGDFVPGVTIEPTINIVSITNNEFVFNNNIELSEQASISTNKQNRNILNTVPSVESGDLAIRMKELQQIDAIRSVYCQDGIAIPFEIDDLFPIGYTKLLCNTTYLARMPLNVTRHETSHIRSEIDSWYNNVGSKIQRQIYQHVSKTLESTKLDFDIADMVENCWPQDHENLFGIMNKLNLRKLCEE